MGPRINKIYGMSRVTSKGSAPELVKSTWISCHVYGDKGLINSFNAVENGENDFWATLQLLISGEKDMRSTSGKESKLTNALYVPEIPKSSRIDDEVIQDQRQQDDNDLQDERQAQPKEEEVEPRRSKRARIEKSFGPDFVSFMVENEPTSYREAVTSSEWLNGKKPLKVK
ncbi:hypothetical protein Tco_0996771 [Tanacetum coccineum]